MVEFLQRNLAYFRYLALHKWYVYKAGRITEAPLFRLVVHDWSKLTPQEWFPYLNFFYPTMEVTPEIKAAFRLAFNHHIHWNRHHIQYWVSVSDDGKIRPQMMPEIYIREMVADWLGAGRAISGKWGAAEWYAKRRSSIPLHPKTKQRVEEILAQACPRLINSDVGRSKK
jgi:hypothetical protein